MRTQSAKSGHVFGSLNRFEFIGKKMTSANVKKQDAADRAISRIIALFRITFPSSATSLNASVALKLGL